MGTHRTNPNWLRNKKPWQAKIFALEMWGALSSDRPIFLIIHDETKKCGSWNQIFFTNMY